ncbi:precorrin-3B C(17)-methyltransferase [Albimonas sp. CAU 1670]|uniref:precorrin-3B C(17)-methyltransferase n=1 Tax=Albimonas sp. CAU 1670 TaxID=3032599 RepID=UPI0023DA0F22|nr:precorrin-3B C(17)-methyltransferase [Albimonas sp. CAU 1670]MDF2232437.1 precorrin-3B C(17)-methyltransferase [Albimonas sp. CAU 1670]
MSDTPVFVALTDAGEALAARALGALAPSADPAANVVRCGPGAAPAAETLRAVFASGRPLVGVMAAGILVRALAPMLGDKRAEPAVVALAEDGSAAVPLLGGHRGANDLARRLGAALGGVAAVTTAGDVSLGVALDAPPQGWRLENPLDAKAAMAGLLAGRPARLSGEAGWLAPLAGRVLAEPAAEDAPVVLTVEGCEPLVYRRARLVLGVGCARFCPPDEMIGLVRKTLAETGFAAAEVAEIRSIDLKSDEAAIRALAEDLGVPARFHAAAELEALTPRLANPSDVVFAEVGCHGVAEASALAGAGEAAVLAIAKVKSASATVAAALRAGEGAPGRRRGQLSVVGIGPGASDWRTPEASRLIAEAEEVVGYNLYIDLLGPLAAGKPRADFALGEEEARCRHALERAGEGRDVALVCSGDAGIYAMGALVMELLDRPETRGGVSAAARRVEIVAAPGISALQAASARVGAVIGHDFCAVSLSDLLTPREDVLKRLRAAAAGDFVTALYNPVSRRRRELLDACREIMLEHRPADTPVLLAHSLGRPEERLELRTLGALRTDEVDMLTVVLIGASRSRAFRSGDGGAGATDAAGTGGWRIYTPRGYAKRIDAPATPADAAPELEKGEVS